MSPKATTTVTTEIKLSIALQKKVLTELRTYAALHAQAKTLKQAMQKRKDEIQALFEKAGEFDALVAGVKLDGFSTKYVAATRKILSKEKLIDLGVTVEMLEESTIEVPSKPYLKVTAPGDSDAGEID